MTDAETRSERLFQPVRIGRMMLRNRIYFPPIGDRYAKNCYVSDELKAYYETRAKGGVGLIIVGGTCVDYPRGWTGPVYTSIDDDKYIPGLTELTRVIKKHGAGAAIQVMHAGGRAQSNVQPISPSAVPQFGYKPARALTTDEIKDVVGLFVNAVVRAQKAGFDGVELQAAHSFLISEFLSSVWNKRQDEYGGSLENRARFLLEIIRASKAAVGQDYPLWCRFNCEELGREGGITHAEAQQIARMLEDAGVDAIHVSRMPQLDSGLPIFSPPGLMLPLADAIKKVATVPVLVAGWITPELGEKALLQNRADLVGLGRALIADPELPNKLATGRQDDVVPCIRCNRCFGERKTFDIMVSTAGIQCSVNAAVGRQSQFRIVRAKQAKKVIIVGGGPAGLEVARVAALRGHKVTLYERDSKLGGQLRLATIPPLKEPIQALIDYLISQVEKSGIDIKLATEFTPELVADSRPDVLVLATGARPFLPKIRGVTNENAVFAESVLAGNAKIGDKVVVVGGDMVGCETAEFLADSGKRVTIATRKPEIATKANWIMRLALLARLAQKGVATEKEVVYQKLTDKGVVVTTKEGKQKLIEADTIVLAAGAESNVQLFQTLQGQIPEIYRVGDCVEPRQIREAISEGAQIACLI